MVPLFPQSSGPEGAFSRKSPVPFTFSVVATPPTPSSTIAPIARIAFAVETLSSPWEKLLISDSPSQSAAKSSAR